MLSSTLAAPEVVKVTRDESKRMTISMLRSTKHELDAIKHPGQSYEGLLKELIQLWQREHRVEEAVVQTGKGGET
ncbi:hypothetical protein ES703_37204 [subsurface metagenome]